MSYDKSCHTLAAEFLSDYPGHATDERVKQLAQAIQETCDDWIRDWRDEDEAKRMRKLYDAEQAAEGRLDHRSQAYAERMYEAADLERKRLREEG